jgi:hypothetical protein
MEVTMRTGALAVLLLMASGTLRAQTTGCSVGHAEFSMRRANLPWRDAKPLSPAR